MWRVAGLAAKRLLPSLPPQNPRHLLQTAAAEIGGEHDQRPLRHVGGERVGAAQAEHLVPHHHLPDVDNERKATNGRGGAMYQAPARRSPLASPARARGCSTSLARSQIGRDLLAVFSAESLALGVDRRLGERPAQQIAEPAENNDEHSIQPSPTVRRRRTR